jgi:molybdate transport system substrate-binding protein
MRRLPWLFAILLSLVALAAHAEIVTVFAAASVKDALDDLVRQYEGASGNKVVVSYASSAALAKQIENGAPAQLFISADLDWMDYLAARQRIDAKSRVNLAHNSLVMIAPAASTVALTIAPGFPLKRALGDHRLAMADPDHVPAGKYGKAALASLGVWSSVERQLARAENVRAALVLVARGEAPLGIVYKTDALVDGRVKVLGEFPAGSHAAIVYPAALASGVKSAAPAQLLAFIAAPAARATWQRYGFMPAF